VRAPAAGRNCDDGVVFATPQAKPPPAQFLRVDASRRTATLTLVSSYDGSNGGFNFDGYSRGEMLVTVPRGWRVVVRCQNRGPRRNSCAVARRGSSKPAFRGASTPRPRQGLPPGGKATFAFRATRLGSYRLTCLVPGHELAREWDVLDVVRGGRPAIRARAGP
jgi:hypothetical protein